MNWVYGSVACFELNRFALAGLSPQSLRSVILPQKPGDQHEKQKNLVVNRYVFGDNASATEKIRLQPAGESFLSKQNVHHSLRKGQF